MMDKRELLRRIDAGEKFEYHFFWKGPFSQWVPNNPIAMFGGFNSVG